MKIERDGDTIVTVKKAMISPLRERFSIDVRGGDDLDAKGNMVDHEYKIERGGDKVAEVSSDGSGCATPTASRLRPARTHR
jgi:uncharacterized protein YxjI